MPSSIGLSPVDSKGELFYFFLLTKCRLVVDMRLEDLVKLKKMLLQKRKA